MATTTLGSKAVGSTVKLTVDGAATEFIVVQQGKPSTLYDDSCDGTWLLMKDVYEKRVWDSSETNDYKNSTIHSYLSTEFLGLFDADVQAAIKEVKLPYYNGPGGGSGSVASGANGLPTRIFLLSGYEVGWTQSNIALNQVLYTFPIDGACLAYFTVGTTTADNNLRIACLNGVASNWWLRSLNSYAATHVYDVNPDGTHNISPCSYSYGIRPALVLPSTLFVTDDGTVKTNTPPTLSGSITLPDTIKGGKSIAISWPVATDADGNLSGYKLERSVNGGNWEQIYQAPANSTTDSITFGWSTVQYRVRAYDSYGDHSDYITGSVRTVFNNSAPSAPGAITVPVSPRGGAETTITWTAAGDVDGNLSGYALERQLDGGEWAQIYAGSGLSYVDIIPKGTLTAAYRVRAYDEDDAYSAYTTSATRTVINNEPPVITCSLSGDLGIKSEGFTVPYTVTDAEGGVITVTEAVGGLIKRTYAATPGEEQTFHVEDQDGDYFFMRILNGPQTIKITAADEDGQSSVLELTFTKAVHAMSVTLAEPLEVEEAITVAIMSVMGSIPADAGYTLEATNNANDAAPVWQDVKADVAAGRNIVFANQVQANGPAYNFRLAVSRGESGAGGYIQSIRGGFQ